MYAVMVMPRSKQVHLVTLTDGKITKSDPTRVYVDTCRKMGIVPIGVVERGLRTRVLQLTHRGLTTNELLSVCNALLVSISLDHINFSHNEDLKQTD